ncbi:hypothetical protein [Marichromatium gracile]|uniref:Uncharacterized protein n=1 Tax=Marichromatium gracile TaxID=1048 RepID=A0ABR5VL86_MARGR|nr:hypothetical protein [Marichromatium gracile]KXX66446.1 hypothetical protein AY586_00575 [Marichromatium gracile]
MKTQLTALTLALLAGQASAGHIYGAFGTGNPDLEVGHPLPVVQTARAGSDQAPFDFHQGVSSPDISPVPQRADASARTQRASFDAYQGLSSPDIAP